HLSRHLLEQPSSSVPGHGTGQWRHPLGQPSSLVLVVAVSFHYSMDRRKPACGNTDSCLWLGATDGGHCFYCFRAHDHCQGRPWLPSGIGHWRRLETETFSCALPRRYPTRLCEPMDRRRSLCVRGAPLVDSC